MEYFNTFGGNPVSAAIATAVLDVIEKENLLDNATKIGNFLKQEFNRLKGKHAIIGKTLCVYTDSNKKMNVCQNPAYQICGFQVMYEVKECSWA